MKKLYRSAVTKQMNRLANVWMEDSVAVLLVTK